MTTLRRSENRRLKTVKDRSALQSLGRSLADAVRTRVFIKRIADWKAFARAHVARFRDIMPANTLVEARPGGTSTWWR
jgi:hypothetical protein